MPEENKYPKGLWALYGKKKNSKDESYICIEIGSSKNIDAEISKIFKLMESIPKPVEAETVFGGKPFTYTVFQDKRSYKYRSIWDQYEDVRVYIIDIDKFIDSFDKQEILDGPCVEFLKSMEAEKFEETMPYVIVNFAEVAYACLYKPVYWNPAPFNKTKENYNIEKKLFHHLKGLQLQKDKFSPEDYTCEYVNDTHKKHK